MILFLIYKESCYNLNWEIFIELVLIRLSNYCLTRPSLISLYTFITNVFFLILISRRWSTPYLRRNATMWRLMCASAYPRRAVRLSRTRLRARSPRSPATRSQGKSANRFPVRSQSTKSTKSVRLLLRRSAPKFQERPAINFM